MNRDFDIVVIGGGHAGAEAAWAASRLGARTALITLDPSKTGQMSCNPAIGGLAKGQMVREVDALGGLMGQAIDNTGIQFRMLNRSKGPAVWGPRAQADKYKYAAEVQRLLATCPNLQVVRGEVAEIVTEEGTEARRHGGTEGGINAAAAEYARTAVREPSGSAAGAAGGVGAAGTTGATGRRVTGVLLADGTRLACRAVIITTGTFLRALMHTGERQTEGGRVGEESARTLSGCLSRLGLELGRLKTGTPPRLHRDSIDFSAFEQQPGDEDPFPFSYLNEYAPRNRLYKAADGIGAASAPNPQTADDIGGFIWEESTLRAWRPPLPQVDCWIGGTNEKIHEIIRANLHRAPMYSGQIASTGPRYCPSIEDKVVRFAEKARHQIFLEPEGLDTDEIYCNGVSTSLPADVQEQIIRLVPGLERAKFLRHGYAVEYDMVWPTEIRSTLETKKIAGLFLAGQINGTSGYEEAAAQGLVAGVNAARYAVGGGADFVLRRDQAYVGVLIDDLVTKPPTEPYRMFTSRAEHRLHLRSDNADERLTPVGRKLGLVDDARWKRFCARRDAIDAGLALLKTLGVDDGSAFDWLRRSEVTWDDLLVRAPAAGAVGRDVGRQIEVRVKYQGYIARQDRQIEKFAKLEDKLIPAALDYARVLGLRNEAKQKFSQFNPRSLGQALRISGITPADVTVLAIHLDRGRPRGAAART